VTTQNLLSAERGNVGASHSATAFHVSVNTFSMIPNAIMRRRDLSATAKLLYARLLQYQGKNDVAWPSINTLAAEIGITGRCVITHLKALKDAKLITVEKGSRYRGSNRYHLPSLTSDGNIISDGKGTTDGSISGSSDGNSTSPVMETSLKENRKTSKKKSNSNLNIVFPDSLKSPEFETAWNEYVEHRRQLRKPLTPLAAQKQLAKLAAIGMARAIAAINHSIANGWSGIFEERQQLPANINCVTNNNAKKYANVGTTL